MVLKNGKHWSSRAIAVNHGQSRAACLQDRVVGIEQRLQFLEASLQAHEHTSIVLVEGQVRECGDGSGLRAAVVDAQPVHQRRESDAGEHEDDAQRCEKVLGIGGETVGPLRIAVSTPSARLEAKDIRADMKGAVVVGGARITAEAVRAARDAGVAAIVSGGIDDADLRDVLGYDLGVAITGTEKIGITIVMTEGFGDIAMAARTFTILKSYEGREASVNGATQIRAGVMRPEIVIARRAGDAVPAQGARPEEGALEIGTQVRLIRDPYFGILGTVVALPTEPAVLGSGSKARVLEVELEVSHADSRAGDFSAARRVTVPRANIELIET